MEGLKESFQGVFQSTLSLRRATHDHEEGRVMGWISIHALLAESDEESDDELRERY